ncbi:MAG: L,D-transpeptidase family protein [Gemmatimonadota bacterium]
MASLLSASGVGNLAGVFFRVLKHEREFEVWARGRDQSAYRLLATYPVCEVSGRLGPKRRQGDFQIPEGFYTIDLLNPWSQYHLSMRVSYPNPVDRARGSHSNLGGDIYIHGGCSTIGCVPVTDEWIEEVYLIAVRARDAGQTSIPVHIYPTRLDEDGLRWLREMYGSTHVDYPFWANLAEGYRTFEATRMLPVIGYEGRRYTFREPPAMRFLTDAVAAR